MIDMSSSKIYEKKLYTIQYKPKLNPVLDYPYCIVKDATATGVSRRHNLQEHLLGHDTL